MTHRPPWVEGLVSAMPTTPPGAARICLLLLLASCLARLVAACPVAAVDSSKHLWPLAAIHFDEPASETATFAMTDDDFHSRRVALEHRIARAYDELAVSLPDEQRALLNAAQQRWLRYLELTDRALKVRLDEPVKVFYGVEGKERKTNVYKDTILATLEYRALDLESWCRGDYAHPRSSAADSAADAADAAGPGETQLTQALALLDEAFGMAVYVMDEVFRGPTQEAQNAFYAWLRSDVEFVRAAAGNDPAAAALALELLQVERMLDLARLQREGWVFFHRERED
ncbi:MAG: hypothetical protein BWY85_00408 [Firmicutes bacterium ADurb.Bin506]|jgi:uncharacterized protein YecT (DUF1311 family)|nr:MAG: hypothetical protein BWY85_00408 [Firmicutes bacterium ADurb.Bin506]